MLNKELEITLNHTYKDARVQRHEFLTVEHLLLALIDNGAAVAVLRACGADCQQLRGELELFIQETAPVLPLTDDRDTQPTLGFQRVLQRAVFHVQSSGKREVTGANVLVALFGERESQAVYLLNKYNVTRLDVVNFISHGITNDPAEGTGAADHAPDSAEGGKSPLEAFTSPLNKLARKGKI
ncbi:MAG: Clp protease N-terminal domain-containing protein, partial [Gammaproteobacteria bacterium]